ncbi:MAG: M18 family aminopeptidase [Clostridia bacterium]|nr:M18 family aminopeptidase [Clostridia bacterium]
MDRVRGLLGFLKNSPTAFHAVENIRLMLEGAGYAPLNEGVGWRIEPGRGYYVTRNRSSIVAFRMPGGAPDHFQIVASHSDSPCFKLKPSAEHDANGYAALNVEKYGGMIMSSWFDRPLSIAGRAIVDTGDGLETRLVYLDRDLAMIPSMPIHFNRDVNEGVKLNPQVDMLPVYGAEGADYLEMVAENLGVERESIVGFDLFLVNRDAPRLWGAEEEFIASPRLDDLECAYASVQALIAARPTDHVDVLCVFDNEEVGSGTKQGADSTFLAEVLRRVMAATNADGQALEAALARSMMLSADNAHAVHPNHPEKYDADNRVRMNGGVVVKFNANQKYTSDGVSQAVFETICRENGVPVQRFANRSDIPGGSTLGNIANAHVSMITVDIGLAQLAMHSANECAGTRDISDMIDAMRAFHEVEIDVVRDGLIRLGRRISH